MRLTMENISKQYKDKMALDGFSIEFNEGLYGLLGPNGSGKTTLMRIIADVLRPTTGRVLMNGEDKNDMQERYRNLIGYLPQEIGLYKEFTVRRFLEYVAALKGINKHQANLKIDELLEIVNLKEHSKRLCGRLSGGMKRRLGIAQALLNDPAILILDEPTAGLDPEERIKFRNLIVDISGDRIVILSTHIVSDIELIAKEIILLKNGKLLKNNTGDELMADMEGRVWSLQMDEAEYAEFARRNGNYLTANLVRKREGIEARIVSDIKPFAGAKPVDATLEDMYLYYFKEKSTSDGMGAL